MIVCSHHLKAVPLHRQSDKEVLTLRLRAAVDEQTKWKQKF